MDNCTSSDPNAVCVNTVGSFSCLCVAGYSRPSTTPGEECAPCPQNSYEDAGVCTPCPANSSSSEGSSNISDCLCNAGFSLTFSMGVCTPVACPAESTNSAVWPSTLEGTEAVGRCQLQYFAFPDIFPNRCIDPKRKCVLAPDLHSAEWEPEPVIGCFRMEHLFSPFVVCCKHNSRFLLLLLVTCPTEPCQNNGTCTPVPCQNNGTCENYCSCPDGFIGKYCETFGFRRSRLPWRLLASRTIY